jgi:hypothetical protein
MHDIESQISKLVGENNFMDKLQDKVIGNIMKVDMEIYEGKINKIIKSDNNIKVLLSRLSNKSPLQQFTNASSKIDLNNAFEMYQRKSSKAKMIKPPRKIVKLYPKQIIDSEYFSLLKQFNSITTEFLHEVFGEEQQTFENFSSKPRELLDIKKIFSQSITTNEELQSIRGIKKFSATIIDQLLFPNYDVEKTIMSNWNIISRIFKPQFASQIPEGFTQENIKKILIDFTIAKYRCDITGNKSHMINMFVGAIGNDQMAEMDGSKFLTILDSLDIEKFGDNNKAIVKYANSVKNIIRKINDGGEITPNILAEFNNLFEMEADTEKPCEEASQFHDLLD